MKVILRVYLSMACVGVDASCFGSFRDDPRLLNKGNQRNHIFLPPLIKQIAGGRKQEELILS